MSKRIHNKRAKPKKDVIYLPEDFAKIEKFEGRYVAGFNHQTLEYKKIVNQNGDLKDVSVDVIWRITKHRENGNFSVEGIAGKNSADTYNRNLRDGQLPTWPIISARMARKIIKDRNLNVYTGELFEERTR